MDKVRTTGDSKNKRKLVFKDMDEGDYMISNEGHIMSLKGTKKIIKPKKEKDRKYLRVKLVVNGKNKIFSIDTLLKKYF